MGPVQLRARLVTLGLIVTILSMLAVPLGAVAQAQGAAAGDGFSDVPASHPNYAAITWLAERGFVKGYGDGRFGADDPIVRGQVAGLITRPLGWQFENWPNTFPDQGALDDELWRNVGTLAHYEVARGFPDGTFRPMDNVVKAQMISFITRAMEKKGYWQEQPDNAALYKQVPVASGHRADLATYQHYVGGIYGTPSTASFPDWDADASRAWVAQVLYDALTLMPAVSVPLTGTGTFNGLMNITNFVSTSGGGIAAVVNVVNGAGQVVASGLTVPVDLAATRAANAPASQSDVSAQATCDILHLVLGPLDLNLLGLVVHLDKVVLDITAQTGADNLLGNLLCGILGLLNPLGTLTQLLDLLNQLSTLLNQLGLGNLTAAAPATATGPMLLDNFSKVGDQLLANGKVAGQPVSAPLSSLAVGGTLPSAADCSILHLVLGPLDLNLLGLVVHLDTVKLDITAQPGSGNLLGNLLCSVANLLNPGGSLSQLLDVLNDILRLL